MSMFSLFLLISCAPSGLRDMAEIDTGSARYTTTLEDTAPWPDTDSEPTDSEPTDSEPTDSEPTDSESLKDYEEPPTGTADDTGTAGEEPPNEEELGPFFGDVSFEGEEAIAAFCESYNVVYGSLSFSDVERINMPCLTEVHGSFYAGGGFSDCRWDGDVPRRGSSIVEEILLPNLTYISGDLSINSTNYITTLDIPLLREVPGDLLIMSCVLSPRETYINFDSLTKIGGAFQDIAWYPGCPVYPDEYPRWAGYTVCDERREDLADSLGLYRRVYELPSLVSIGLDSMGDYHDPGYGTPPPFAPLLTSVYSLYIGGGPLVTSTSQVAPFLREVIGSVYITSSSVSDISSLSFIDTIGYVRITNNEDLCAEEAHGVIDLIGEDNFTSPHANYIFDNGLPGGD